MQARFGSVFGRVRDGASVAGQQASNAWTNGSAMASAGSSSLMQSFSLPGEAQKAAEILKHFLADPERPATALNAVPKAVLMRAKGIAIFTIVKAGFIFSGKAGSGLVIARLPDGSWSAPSCIATAGVGWGLQIGADLTEVVIILNSDEAVKAFSRGGNVTVGGGVSAAAGPLGTGGAVTHSLVNPAPMFSYSRSKGLFAGLTLDGTILVERKDANKAFYGSSVSSTDILTGRVPPPEIAGAMYDTIEAAEGLDETGLPSEAYVPGAEAQPGGNQATKGQQAASAASEFPGQGHTLGAGNQTVFDADKGA